MARARNLKPQFFKDADLGEVTRSARLLFAGLWTIADCEGRLVDDPRWIKAEVFPYDADLTPGAVDALLLELSVAKDGRGFIVRYEVEGHKYIQISAFSKHQNPHKNERDKGSEIPREAESRKVRSTREKSGALGKNSEEYGTAPDVLLNPSSLNHESLSPGLGETPEPAAEPPKPPRREFPRGIDPNEADDSPIARKRFKETAVSVGIDGSPNDWEEAAATWRTFDFEQKLAAIEGLTARPTDDPVLRSLPQNYLRRRMWLRPIRAAPSPGRAKSTHDLVLEMARKKDLERAERLKNAGK